MRNRQSIRLREYDYSQAGLYFITICTHNRECLFGLVEQSEMILNDIGHAANACWLEIPNHFPNAVLHAHIIMPNHVHGIVQLVDSTKNDLTTPQSNATNEDVRDTPIVGFIGRVGDAGNVGAENFLPLQYKIPQRNEFQQMIPRSIGSIVKGYKIGVTKWCRNTWGEQFPHGKKIWQRNYHEHIIRNTEAYDIISNYILKNPESWETDKFFI
jgi:putative transposase